MATGIILSNPERHETFHLFIYGAQDERWSGWYDPKEPITSRHVAYVAQKLDLSIDEVHRQYEAIADRLRIALDLEWRKAN
jgi:hypothetical protein